MSTPEIRLTESAVNRVKLLQQRKQQPDLMLRLKVDGGGCAGFQYLFEFDQTITEEDQTFERDGVKLIIDEMSLGFMEGAEIDFKQQMVGAAFQVNNPNASSSCGCGTSFSV